MATERKIISVDPVTFEVVKNSLYSICEEMKGVITRTAFSPLINLSSDLSCAVLTGKGEVVGQGNDIPVHLGAMPFTVQGAVKIIGIENIEPGDAILMNDPYSGGSHLPDICLINPIFHKGKVVAFAANRTHWPDVGGMAPGSSSGGSNEIYQEGLRIPPVKLWKRGKIDKELLDLILLNTRVAHERLGDLNAQYAGNMRGVQRIGELIEKYGPDVVDQVMEDTMNYSQHLVEEEIEKVPDGVYYFEDCIDGDGFDDDSKDLMKICSKVTVKGRKMIIDFTGTSKTARGPINAPLAVTSSAVYYCLLAITNPLIPPNSGCYRVVEIIAPEDTMVNPKHPAPVVAGNTDLSNRIAECVLGALAQAIPDKVIAACYGSACPVSFGGVIPEDDRHYVYYEAVPGGFGARPNKDGINGVRTHMGNTGNIPVESAETNTPLMITRYELIPDSGGAGKYAGGCGVRRIYKVVSGTSRASVTSERSKTPPWGLFGGKTGRGSSFRIQHRDGTFTSYPSKMEPTEVRPGESFWVETAGSGGYGNPSERDSERILDDILNGYTTLERARADYGPWVETEWTKFCAARSKKVGPY